MATQLTPPWDKADVLIKALAGIALPVALALVGYWFSAQEQERTTRQLQADRVERMLSHLTSENPRQRVLAIRVSRFLAERRQLPPELLDVLIATAEGDPERKVSEEAVEALGRIAESDIPEEQRRIASEALRTLPERVYIRISDESQRPEAEELAEKLSARGFVVPDIKNVGSGPSRAEVRFFSGAEREEARRVAALVEEMERQRPERRVARPQPLLREPVTEELVPERPAPKSRTLELWLPRE
ncbi:LytR C-terminal domain-containing protein [Archangium violaceum]|uniref:LytR/CpsA/Psr regulator C-terminal domain-containing protein n=1 Tax=Archangium violaceum Cb vi76 TaxID=1406225 RepID=A0A084SXQ8_9BACT|nr:LytR C-terminal domain-containing protein [Archangium violaceum]KFA93243.1 hypothetical protein Q664_10255 [Archangium violaceum Cb vi76]